MNAKQLLTLLAPTLLTLVLFLSAFAMVKIGQRSYIPSLEQERREKFSRFLEDVKNGARQLTPEETTQYLRRERRLAEAEQDLNLNHVDQYRNLGWTALIAFVCQVAVILYVRKQLNRKN